MVRFYWHVDDGCSAHVPVNGVTLTPGGVRHTVEMDVPGVAGSALGMLTMPPYEDGSYTTKLKKIGVVIAHDTDAASWQGPLISSIAQVRPTSGRAGLKAAICAATARHGTFRAPCLTPGLHAVSRKEGVHGDEELL